MKLYNVFDTSKEDQNKMDLKELDIYTGKELKEQQLKGSEKLIDNSFYDVFLHGDSYIFVELTSEELEHRVYFLKGRY